MLLTQNVPFEYSSEPIFIPHFESDFLPSLDTLEITSEFAKNVTQKSAKKLLQKSGSSLAEIEGNLLPDDLFFNTVGKAGNNLEKRALSKYFNTIISAKLLGLKSPLNEKYQDTFYCSDTINKIGETARSTFCKNRWCLICNRIRTAQLHGVYMPTLESWKEKSFLTLTVKNVPPEKLRSEMQKMYKTFTQIKDIERKRGNKLVGLRKLETTYNRFTNEYHPHYHLIQQNGERDERIIENWLDRFPTADRKGQDTKPADKNSCFELFKYFTKLTSNSSKDKKISVHALDHICQSIQGVRTFQPFGFIAHKLEPPKLDLGKKESEQGLTEETFNYFREHSNWISQDGEFLTDFKPTKENEQFIKNVR